MPRIMRGMPQFKGFNDWIDIFRAGEQTDSRGRARTWTNDELDQIVANHVSAGGAHDAPAVVGHPKTDAPAYGWAQSLRRVGDTLQAKFHQVEGQFENMVREGRFKKRSVAIGNDGNGFFLRHVGWLGAAAPAVPGLKDAQFEAGEEVFEFEGDWITSNLLGRLARRMRDFMIEKFGLETADQVIPDYLIEEANSHSEASRLAPSKAEPAFAGHLYSHPSLHNGGSNMPAAAKTFTQEEVDQAIADAEKRGRESAGSEYASHETELKQQLETERRTRLAGEYRAEVDKAIDAGKLTPGQAEGIVEFMQELSDGDDAQFEFSVGEGDKKKTEKVSPRKWFSDFINRLGKQIELGESRQYKSGAEPAGRSSTFSAPSGYGVDEERAELDRQAREYMAAHPKTEYLDAVQAVINQ